MSKLNPSNGQLTIIDQKGNERLCQILFTIESEEFNKKYVIFYPVAPTEEEEGSYLAASYIENEDGQGELTEITTDEEWDMLQEALNQFTEENSSSCDECDEDSDCTNCPFMEDVEEEEK